MVDQLRADQLRQRHEYEVASQPTPASPEGPAADDSLTLLFLCCHPILTPVSQVALTLRAVGGLTTAEIAHAYGVTEAAMGQRISRAKQQIRSAGGQFVLPSADDRGNRLTAVLQVLYLIFNEGYAATAGEQLQRVDLTTEAIRLARMLHRLMPDEPEVTGVLALMLLSDARRPARSTATGDLVTMEHQQRDQWDRALTAEGTALITTAMQRRLVGPYQLQAAIAALHNRAPQLRRNRLAANRHPVRLVGAADTHPSGPAQQGGRGSDGVRPSTRHQAAGRFRRRPAHPTAGASRSRPPARTQRRHPAGRRTLPRSGRPYR
jgi:predicted RNA polymerase sigma factor